MVAISNNTRINAQEIVRELNKTGIETVMITGDSKKTAIAIGRQLSVRRINSEVMPQDKISIIKRLQNEGRTIAMIGSANDTDLLIQADLGIAFNAGAVVDINAADIILMRSDIKDALFALKFIKRVVKNAQKSSFAAYTYNIVGIIIAAGLPVLANLYKISPVIAAFFSVFISIFILMNALRLKNFKTI
jgi:Cu+-exporting ATPase